MKNVLECLEETGKKYPQKIAVDDGKNCLTYAQILDLSQRMGSDFCKVATFGKPIVLLMEKSANVLAAMFGVVYAGGFYVMVDPSQPISRIQNIFQVLNPELIVTDLENESLLKAMEYQGRIFRLEEASQGTIEREVLLKIRAQSKETDLLYGIFTSGSTGTPKGIVVSHQAVLQFISHFTQTFGICDKDCIGNQAPFDFDVSVKDIYSSIMTGATLVLIPKEYFSTPPRLLDYLCDKKVTTLIWAVSALCLVSMLKGLNYKIPTDVRQIMFSGEVMPLKQLRLWQTALPNTSFVNLYGPTEITCNCTYYPIKGLVDEQKKLPIGRPFLGREVFLLDEKDKLITVADTAGEICVTGESISEGYYNNPKETAKRFVFYPADAKNAKRCYRTGDLGYYGLDGELYFSGRKDFQIKHMGHRIELEEIERALDQVEGLTRSCCLLDTAKNRLVAFYMGEAEPAVLRRELKEKIPVYMVPGKFIKVDEMPLNKNGKTDRSYFMDKLEDRKS